MTLMLHSVCSPSENLVAREIEGEMILVPLTAGTGDAQNEIFTLNELGQALWGKLDGQRSLQAVADLLCEEFDAPRETIKTDLLAFARDMAERGMLSEG